MLMIFDCRRGATDKKEPRRSFRIAERTWTLVTISAAVKDLMKTYIQYLPRKLQSATYTGPLEISKYQQFEWLRAQLGKEGFDLPMPTGN